MEPSRGRPATPARRQQGPREPKPPHRHAGLPWYMARYLPAELGGGAHPPILVRIGLMLARNPPKRPDDSQLAGSVSLGIGTQAGWKFEGSPDAAIESGYWRELRSLTAILGGKIGGGRAPGETLRILWEIEQRHRERRLPERTPASDM